MESNIYILKNGEEYRRASPAEFFFKVTKTSSFANKDIFKVEISKLSHLQIPTLKSPLYVLHKIPLPWP